VNSLVEDKKFMREALLEAEEAYRKREIPVGAIVVLDERIIGRGHNQRESLNDPTAHGEILAIGAAANAIGNWRLEGTSLYVTLEPCPMCAGAIVLARIKRLIFGVKDPKGGACGSLYQIVQDPRLNHKVEVCSGILEKECEALLKLFFQELRRSGRIED